MSLNGRKLPPVVKFVLECVRDGRDPWAERGAISQGAVSSAFRRQRTLGRIQQGELARNLDVAVTGQHFVQITPNALTDSGREALAFDALARRIPREVSPTRKVCMRCRSAGREPAWDCRGCGATCCEHLCGFKDSDGGTASCVTCQIGTTSG